VDLPIAAIPLMHVDLSLILLRIIHILSGTLWVGVLWTLVLSGLVAREGRAADEPGTTQASHTRLLRYVNAAAVASVGSGLFLYWENSTGLSREWIVTPRGMVLTGAGLVGVVAAIDGWIFSRAAAGRLRAAYLSGLALTGMAASRYLQ